MKRSLLYLLCSALISKWTLLHNDKIRLANNSAFEKRISVMIEGLRGWHLLNTHSEVPLGNVSAGQWRSVSEDKDRLSERHTEDWLWGHYYDSQNTGHTTYKWWPLINQLTASELWRTDTGIFWKEASRSSCYHLQDKNEQIVECWTY